MIRSVGRFDHFVGNNLPLSRVTVVYAENARGKTTLAAILRSLATGASRRVLERRRLGSPQSPHIVIDADGAAPAIFQNGGWSRTLPDIAIFDDTFVADNVCSGVDVGTSHRQNLHELIIGAQGIALNAALQTQVDAIEAHNVELRLREADISESKRGGLTVDAFCALAAVPNLAHLVEEAERRLAAARASGRVVSAPTFPILLLPAFDLDGIGAVLRQGLPDVDADALNRVQAHLSGLGRSGEAWVSEGMSLADKLASEGRQDCPFCAQDLNTSPVLAHYRTYFGDAYKGLKATIATAMQKFAAEHSGDVPAAFERTVRQVVECYGFWKEFAELSSVEIDTAQIALAWKVAREGLQRLLETKRASPLDPVNIPDDLRRAVAAYNMHRASIETTASELQAANRTLNLVKEQAKDANIAILETDLRQLRATEARHDPAMANNCERYLDEKAAKATTEAARRAARTALDAHRAAAFPAYGIAINDFLQRFNASFRLGPVDAVNNRAGSSANYTLLIDNHAVPLSSADGEHGFRNTLSAGDRNTLALAFFFASLQNDPARAQKIVVIDDPMTSLDEQRALHTLQEMDRLARDVRGMIVLSHSKAFLLGVWERCEQLAKTALEIRRAGAGSTIASWDVNAAMVTEHDRRYAAARAYLDQGVPATARSVAQSLRPMLEVFMRVAFAVDFPPGTMLGPFYGICIQRVGTQREILGEAATAELRAILDYANRFHHDTNAAYATEIINDGELENFTRRTLRFIGRS